MEQESSINTVKISVSSMGLERSPGNTSEHGIIG